MKMNGEVTLLSFQWFHTSGITPVYCLCLDVQWLHEFANYVHCKTAMIHSCSSIHFVNTKVQIVRLRLSILISCKNEWVIGWVYLHSFLIPYSSIAELWPCANQHDNIVSCRGMTVQILIWFQTFFCSSQNPIFRLLIYWKLHIFSSISDLFQAFQTFCSQTLSHPCSWEPEGC